MKFLRLFKLVFKKYVLFGLFVLAPFYITVKFFLYIVSYFDGLFAVDEAYFLYWIPERFHPNSLLGFPLPGLGLLAALLLLFLTGLLSRNYLGGRLIKFGDHIVDHIPLARNIYNFIKEVFHTFASDSHYDQFKRVVLIQYPRKGVYVLAFVTGSRHPYITKAIAQNVLSVFVPTTPNPTSGFLFYVTEDETIPIDLAIEDAFKVIVSGGMATPQKETSPPL